MLGSGDFSGLGRMDEMLAAPFGSLIDPSVLTQYFFNVPWSHRIPPSVSIVQLVRISVKCLKNASKCSPRLCPGKGRSRCADPPQVCVQGHDLSCPCTHCRKMKIDFRALPGFPIETHWKICYNGEHRVLTPNKIQPKLPRLRAGHGNTKEQL